MSDDSLQLPQLSRRQEEILALIVRAYTQSPEPVSSKYLVENTALNFSSATIRNEMARLEEMGYISAPHTSAGRIPTTMGYRYFVKRLTSHEGDLTAVEQSHIAHKLDTPSSLELWMRQSATVLARTTRSASLVTHPIAENTRFKHIELIAIQGRLTLMVLVLHGGTVHQRMFNLAEPVQQLTLSEIATRLNKLFADLNGNEISLKSVQLPLLDREIADLIVELMESSDKHQVRMIYRDGLSEIITTFRDSEGAQQAVRVFEERAFLNMILNEIFEPLLSDKVQVIIAGNGRWEELSSLTMVMSRYGTPGQLSGTLGVLGPTHINYERAISAVRYVSSFMTDMLEDLYQTDTETHNNAIDVSNQPNS